MPHISPLFSALVPVARGAPAHAAPERTAPGKQTGGSARTGRSHAAAVHAILSTALVAERVATTFYYTALTTPAILRHPSLGGRSADPNNPGLPPDGNPHHVRYLQAALDAEARHAAMLTAAGALAHGTSFYFPAGAFARLGDARETGSFLGVLDQLETTCIGLYLAAVAQLCQLGRLDLAQMAAALSGVEAEHRMLGRVIANIAPANNLTLEQDPFADVNAALAALHPFLSGSGFSGGASRPIALPSAAHVRRIVGKYGTRNVHGFL